MPFDPDKPITTEAEVLALIARFKAQHPRHTNPAPSPAPAETAPALPTLAGATPEQSARIIEAHAAVKAEADMKAAVEASRELLRAELPAKGWNPDFVDDMPNKVLELAGVTDRPMTPSRLRWHASRRHRQPTPPASPATKRNWRTPLVGP